MKHTDWHCLTVEETLPKLATSSKGLNDAEVEQVLNVPLTVLQKPQTLRRKLRIIHGESMFIPYYDVNGACIWGATAMILSELLAVVAKPLEESAPVCYHLTPS